MVGRKEREGGREEERKGLGGHSYLQSPLPSISSSEVPPEVSPTSQSSPSSWEVCGFNEAQLKYVDTEGLCYRH